jgi:signal transduction histidine kinase
MLNDKDAQYPEKRMEVYKNGESVINDMYTELRTVCFDLMPQTLIKKGLTLALREFGDWINQSNKLNCEVIVFSNKKRLPELVEISLFRICQEWVNNVMKYAQASHITIQLTRDETELTLTVEDNGNGFDSELFYNGKGNGWENIQIRLNLIKGEFDLDTHPDRLGSIITINLDEEKLINLSEDRGLESTEGVGADAMTDN